MIPKFDLLYDFDLSRRLATASAAPKWHWLSLLLLPAVVTIAVPDWMTR